MRRLGLGASQPDLQASGIYSAFLRGYTLINRSQLSPVEWHLSCGAGIPKANGEAGAAAYIVVHLLDEQGKAFFFG